MRQRAARGLPGVRRTLSALAALLGCGGADPGVARHPQPAFAAAQRVLLPPPPALPESLASEPPSPSCRWVDGQRVWTSQRWDWRPGGWIQPPEDCRYSLPSLSWVEEQGTPTLYYRPGRWYSVSEPKACPDPAPCGGSAGGSNPPRPVR